MIGRIFRIAAIVIVLPVVAYAQSWSLITGAFLEPTQFTLAKSLDSRALRLQMGYGGEVFGYTDTVHSGGGRLVLQRSPSFGLEGLVWSRLEALSQFRFPVETADYFFGVYSLFYIQSIDPDFSSPFRIRLSHISSHLVDGVSDTVLGGSSSHYSREFLSMEKLFHTSLMNMSLEFSVGVRYVFHQVTKVEPSFQVPATIELGLLPNQTMQSAQNIFLTLSSAGDPSGPSFSGAITYRASFSEHTSTDMYISYLSGPSLEGNYASQKVRLFEIGMRLHPR